jgi:hypothetical protein
MDTFLQNLRSRTSEQHSLLEQNTASKNLLCQQVTVAHYAAYLSLLYGFLKGFEKIVFPILKYSITDIEARRKTHLIVSDLNLLGIDEAGIASIPDAFFFRGLLIKCNSTRRHVCVGRIRPGRSVYLQTSTNNLGYRSHNGQSKIFYSLRQRNW